MAVGVMFMVLTVYLTIMLSRYMIRIEETHSSTVNNKVPIIPSNDLRQWQMY
jgi:hypothetical protein